MPGFASVKDPVEVRYDRVARFYDALTAVVEWFVSRNRRLLLRQARGSILEVGVGTGSSFKDYPRGKRIVAVDISRGMLSRAEAKTKNYEGVVNLRREDVQRLSFGNGTFDTVFTSCVFCSVSDPLKGLGELHRVLRSGGKLLMVEHVRSRGKVLGWVMDKLNPMVARYGVDNINRDTVDVLRKVGFRIEHDRNLAYDVVKAIVAVK
ncbi:MAG TPA: class I SAM-dependent methyltransferase [Candidatus Bathyarchaeia archaeon]|nr:class I SAM-dependent methyltransferase [Candidatus Bathyarchaeia archaeon]